MLSAYYEIRTKSRGNAWGNNSSRSAPSERAALDNRIKSGRCEGFSRTDLHPILLMKRGRFLIGRWDAKSDPGAVLRIGVISDTHGLLRPQVEQRLAGVAHIVHAGDIGRPDVIAGLRRIAPVTAIRGNVDTGGWAACYPDFQLIRLGGRCIYVLHDLKELQLDPVASGVDVVVSGHSHQQRIETINGVLYLNPGSAGPRRFNLPVTLATLELTASILRPLIHDLGGFA